MKLVHKIIPLVLVSLCTLVHCSDSNNAETPGTTSDAGSDDGGDAAAQCNDTESATLLDGCFKRTKTDDYYVDQANKYFDALDKSAPAESVPTYSEFVARWEWPPWLKLTGYTRDQMESSDKSTKKLAPGVVVDRDCRAFDTQPFARCRVNFVYDDLGGGKPCAIYEEFAFNEKGEMTFVEAWSDIAELLPFDAKSDPWAEQAGVHRMSTKMPGLGTQSGQIDIDGAAMKAAMKKDEEIADFVARAKDFWPSWIKENQAQGSDYFDRGCGWKLRITQLCRSQFWPTQRFGYSRLGILGPCCLGPLGRKPTRIVEGRWEEPRCVARYRQMARWDQRKARREWRFRPALDRLRNSGR